MENINDLESIVPIRKSKKKFYIVIGIVILILVALAVGWYLVNKQKIISGFEVNQKYIDNIGKRLEEKKLEFEQMNITTDCDDEQEEMENIFSNIYASPIKTKEEVGVDLKKFDTCATEFLLKKSQHLYPAERDTAPKENYISYEYLGTAMSRAVGVNSTPLLLEELYNIDEKVQGEMFSIITAGLTKLNDFDQDIDLLIFDKLLDRARENSSAMNMAWQMVVVQSIHKQDDNDMNFEPLRKIIALLRLEENQQIVKGSEELINMLDFSEKMLEDLAQLTYDKNVNVSFGRKAEIKVMEGQKFSVVIPGKYDVWPGKYVTKETNQNEGFGWFGGETEDWTKFVDLGRRHIEEKVYFKVFPLEAGKHELHFTGHESVTIQVEVLPISNHEFEYYSNLLLDANSEVIKYATRKLGDLADKNAIDLIIEKALINSIISDSAKYGDIYYVAMEALGKLTGQTVDPFVAPNGIQKYRDWWAMAKECDNGNTAFKDQCYQEAMTVVYKKYKIGSESAFSEINELKPTDVSECDQFLSQESKDYCLANVSIELQDLSICKQIETNKHKDYCLAVIAGQTQDLSSCALIRSSDEKDSCYYSMAYDNDNPHLCDNIKSQSQRDVCYYGINNGINDPTICFKIQGDQHKKSCYEDFFLYMKIDNPAQSDCQLVDQQNEKDTCYNTLAINEKDVDICNNISDTIKKEECYIYVSTVTKDFTYCNYLQDHTTKSNCFLLSAKYSLDFSECTKIPLPHIFGPCYKYLASETEDIKICEQLDKNNVAAIDDCYKAIADKKNDASFCDLVVRKHTKEKCIKSTKN